MSDETPPDLASLLRAAREDLPSDDALRQLRARVAGAAGGGGGSPIAPHASRSVHAALLAAGLGVVMLASGIAIMSARSPEPRPSTELAVAEETPPAPTARAEDPAPAPDPDVAPEDAVAPSPAPSPRIEPRDRPSEVELVGRARRAEPRDALMLLARHRALYRDGVLAEERDVLEIEALAALGRSTVRRRAETFFVHHPGSVHHERVVRALDTTNGATR